MRFVIVKRRRRNADYHAGLAISTKRVLKEPSKLRISVRHMTALPRIAESVDAIAESEEGAIDVCAFSQSSAFVHRHAGPLRPG